MGTAVHGYQASRTVSRATVPSYRMWQGIESLMLRLCQDLVWDGLCRCMDHDCWTQPVEPVVYVRMADRLEGWLRRQQWLDEDEEQCMKAWLSFLRYCGGFATQ